MLIKIYFSLNDCKGKETKQQQMSGQGTLTVNTTQLFFRRDFFILFYYVSLRNAQKEHFEIPFYLFNLTFWFVIVAAKSIFWSFILKQTQKIGDYGILQFFLLCLDFCFLNMENVF